jgi:hypothetical protein
LYLTEVTIGSGVTVLNQYLFTNCTYLKKVIIRGNITTINKYAFNFCSKVEYYDFTNCTAVPTLSATNAFASISSSTKIYVPDALYDSWKTATNWTTHASKIYKASTMPA